MNLFDTHFHLDPSESPVDFSAKCEESGVCRTLLCGGNWEDSQAAERFAAAVQGCLFAAGVHPNEASSFQGDVSQFKVFANHPKFAAVGEIGLDFHYSSDSRERQETLLAEFLALALELGKPAVLHCRDAEGREDAYQSAFELLSPFAEQGGRFELHCFSGTAEWAARFVTLGSYFGVGGMITFKKAQNIRSVVSGLPLDRILLETDAPYLAPVPHRGKTNHPSLLPHTAKALAELLGMSLEETAAKTSENALRFLNVR